MKQSHSCLCTLIIFVFIQCKNVEGSCKLNDIQGTGGECKPIKECKFVIQQLYAGLQNEVVRCSETRGRDKTVCCPTEKTLAQKKCDEWKSILHRPEIFSQQPHSKPQCAISQPPTELTGFIVGGRTAREFEFPHAVGLGYGNDQSNPKFLCGATLISEDALLTAAHCITNTYQGKPRWALLGDVTLSSATSPHRKLVEIADWIVHPNYNPPLVYDDVAIIKLKQKLELSKYLLPACLGDPVLTPKDGNNDPVTAVGWGQVGYLESASDELQATRIQLQKLQTCTNAYEGQIDKPRKFPEGFKKTQICAGDLISASMNKLSNDTCNGDSGGGIFVTPEIHCLYHVLGVTSFGSKTCGYGIPALYTKVASYTSWIESIAFN